MCGRFLWRWIYGGTFGTPAVKAFSLLAPFGLFLKKRFLELLPDRWTDASLSLWRKCVSTRKQQNSDSGLRGAADTGDEEEAAR